MKPEILYSLSYGMFGLGVKTSEGRPSASIVNTVMQVASDPMTVAVSVHHDNFSNECIRNNRIFTVSVLSEETSAFTIGSLGFRSGRDTDKLAKLNYHLDSDGLPVLEDNICCYFKCMVMSTAETPTHTIFLGEVIEGSDESVGTPMTYRYYHNVVKGKTPSNAPHS